MPRRFTMSDLRTRALQQVDLDTDGAFSDPTTVNRMISAQYGDLYGVVSAAARRYFETTTTITTTGATYIAEPVDHLATIDTIERVVNTTTGRLRRLRRIEPQERSVWSGRTGHARRWEMVDDRIYLYPTPPSGDQYVLRYIQQPPDLATYADGDVVDVVTPDGEGFMIWGCAVRFLGRVRSDVTLAIQEREQARARLLDWARDREFNDPHRTIVEDDLDDGPYCDGEYWYDR
jgi:hypothetical protein